jgi:prepilin-type N-terminal cleavage/methylation domain-containing protein
VVKSSRGFTLMEVVVTLAVFGMFLVIIVILTSEMRRNEKRYPINYMAHPEVEAVMSRLRRDILDAKYYPAAYQGYQQTNKTLLLYTLQQTGFGETVVYDFRTNGEVHRKAFNATQQSSDWVARGVPDFEIGAYSLNTGQDAVRITAKDAQNQLAIDQIFLPRPHD